VKAALRGFGGAVLALGLLGLAGCGTDNQSEAEKAQKNLGAIPSTTGKVGETKPAPSSYDQRGAPDPTGGDYGKRGTSKK
jgi:hypothetical protein